MRIHGEYHSPWSLIFIIFASLVLTGYIWLLSDETNRSYDETSASLGSQPTIVMNAELGENTLIVPSYSLFGSQNIWQYVSPDTSLPSGYKPKRLVPVDVAHSEPETPYLADYRAQSALKQLFEAASHDGLELMLSSAYRSEQEQQNTYDTLLQKQGQSYVSQYVAKPRHSEHQTGLAVDITTASSQCRADSYQCLITRPVVEWLQANAHHYGFIQRYPSGKQSITGTASEEWHYRYVGKPLSIALTESGLTLDEFVTQVAPGYKGISKE